MRGRATPTRRMLCASVLVFTALVSLTGGSWSDGHDSVDRPKGDLPGMPVFLGRDQSARACAQLCASSWQCAAWSYRKADCWDEKAPSCYLKDSVSQQTYNPCMVNILLNAFASLV